MMTAAPDVSTTAPQAAPESAPAMLTFVAAPADPADFDILVELSMTIGRMVPFETLRADPHQPLQHEWRAKIRNTPALVLDWLQKRGFDPGKHTLIAVTFDKNTDVLLCMRNRDMSTLQIVEEGREDGALKRES